MLLGEIKESKSANWEQVGLHWEVRTERFDFILIKPSIKTIVQNTHAKDNAFKKRETDRQTQTKTQTQTQTEPFLNIGYNILATYENEKK